MSTEDRSPQGRGPQHTTHYDDCGCQSAALRARIAELERRDSEFDKLHAVQVARVEILIGAKAAQAARIATLEEQAEQYEVTHCHAVDRIATLEAELAASREDARAGWTEQAQMALECYALLATANDLRAALEKLACLGNGDMPGNSEGNVIAQRALAANAVPAASLAAHDAEVLERAAKACDERRAFYDGLCEQAMAEAEVDAEAEGVAVSTLDADFYDEKAGVCHQLAVAIRALAAQSATHSVPDGTSEVKP